MKFTLWAFPPPVQCQTWVFQLDFNPQQAVEEKAPGECQLPPVLLSYTRTTETLYSSLGCETCWFHCFVKERPGLNVGLPKLENNSEFKVPLKCKTPHRCRQHWGHSPRRNTRDPCYLLCGRPAQPLASHSSTRHQEASARSYLAHSLSCRRLAGTLRWQPSPPAAERQKHQAAQAARGERRSRGLRCVSHEAQV